MKNRLGLLLAGALATAAFASAVISIASVGEQVRRLPAPVVLAPTAAALNQEATHPQPDAADYGTIRAERQGLDEVAKALLLKIESCERSVADPYGAGLPSLNECLAVPMRVNIMRARLEPLLLTGALRNMRDGACGRLTAALLSGTVDLGDASDAWTGDVGLPGRTQSRRERGDLISLRQIAGGLIRIAGLRAWRTVCRPRRYDAGEHGGRSIGAHPARKRLAVHLVS